MFLHGFLEIAEWNEEKRKSCVNLDYSDYQNFVAFFEFLAQILQYPYSGGSSPGISLASLLGRRLGGGGVEPMDVDNEDDHDNGHRRHGNVATATTAPSIAGLCPLVCTHLNTDTFTKEFRTDSKLLENVCKTVWRNLSPS